MSEQVVLITGCSTGIGRALAQEFASRKGTFVYASARRITDLQDLKTKYSNLETIALDVTNSQSIQTAVETIIKQKSRIDILVNNAGVSHYGPSAEVNLDDCRKLFDTNVFGAWALIQAVVPHMAKQHGGKILNVCSITAILATPFSGAYGASKAALKSLSDTLRMELAPFNIKVIVVDPGAIKSSIADNGTANNTNKLYETTASLYYAIADRIAARARASQQNPTPAEEFARKTVSQVLRQFPPAHYRYGRMSSIFYYLSRWAPVWLTDYILSSRFGLRDLAKWVRGAKINLPEKKIQ